MKMANHKTKPAQVPAPNAAGRLSHLEQELATALERHELVWQATNDILYDLHISSGEVIWNDALCRQFGYSKHELVGSLEWWVSHIHPDDALNVEDGLNKWFESNSKTWKTEYRFQRANGTYSYVLDRGFMIRGADGTPERIIGTLLDITEQKRLERAKDEFISLVSHQLRTPLTIIRIYGDMFAEGLLGKLTDTQAEHIARMTAASVKLIKLVDDILNVSRVELGSFDINRSWVNANEVVRRTVSEAQVVADIKQVTIAFKPSRSAQRIFTDAECLEQILENLLSNAVRYTSPKHGKITVSCSANDTELTISVRDNGIGIPRAEQKRIFERFYRAHNAVNIEEHGTGLGLYLAQILTRMLGGQIRVESAPKIGSTFYLTLPKE